jgi:probable phosphoglycerate mutase
MIEAQSRMVGEIETLLTGHLNQTVALVSHLDPLRSLIMHCLGIPLDLLLRFEISPASVSGLRYIEGKPIVSFINHTCGWPT